MGRIIAIDYGKKRCGIAVTDELQLIASGLTTVPPQTIFKFLTDYLQQESVEMIIIGEPKQMDNTPSKSESLIKPFIQELRKRFPDIPVKRIDERFTSKMAVQTMIYSGLKKKQRQNKSLVDEISAIIILQSYLYNR